MKNIWREYFRSPAILITIAYLSGFGCVSAARLLGVTVVLGFAP